MKNRMTFHRLGEGKAIDIAGECFHNFESHKTYKVKLRKRLGC